MKKNLLACLALSVALMGCAATPAGGPPPTVAQQAITATTNSYDALDLGIINATAAVRSGTLKGQDATNAYKAMVAAQQALSIALVSLRNAQAAANAAAAASAPPSTGQNPAQPAGAKP